MMRTATADHVVTIVERMSGTEANRDSRLVEDLELDSLDRIALAMELEEHFAIEITDAEVDDPKLGTVAGLIDCVEAKMVLLKADAALAKALPEQVKP